MRCGRSDGGEAEINGMGREGSRDRGRGGEEKGVKEGGE